MTNIQNDVELNIGQPTLNQGLMAMSLMYIGGIIDSNQIANLRRLVIRATRCQAYVRSFECDVDIKDQLVGDDYDQ